MYRIHHLVALRAVHRTGSFAVAARALGYTASAISQQIAALERATGLVLFERDAAGVRATASADRLDLALVYSSGACPRRWPADVMVTPLLREQLLLLRGVDTAPADLPELAAGSTHPVLPGVVDALPRQDYRKLTFCASVSRFE